VHEWKSALRNLAIVWLFAGFGEEIGYRGYLLTRPRPRQTDQPGLHPRHAIRRAALRLWALLQSPAGVMDSTYSGLVLAASIFFPAAIYGLRYWRTAWSILSS